MNVSDLISELIFKAIKSSGSGGQHVNKVASKIELQFDLANSEILSEAEKNLLFATLQSRLTKDQRLIMQCGESRSQHKNKKLIIERFLSLIEEGLHVQEERKPTKIPKAIKRKRLKSKRVQSEKKINRKKPDLEL